MKPEYISFLSGFFGAILGAQYRARRIVSYRGMESYQRKLKQQAPTASREAHAERINPADH